MQRAGPRFARLLLSLSGVLLSWPSVRAWLMSESLEQPAPDDLSAGFVHYKDRPEDSGWSFFMSAG